MSVYYILLPGDTEKDAILDTNLLGESSFNKFYPGRGFEALVKMIDKQPEILNSVVIKTDRNETLTIEEFLKHIDKLQLVPKWK